MEGRALWSGSVGMLDEADALRPLEIAKAERNFRLLPVYAGICWQRC